MVIGFNLYDIAKIIAVISIGAVVLMIFSLPIQAFLYVLDSFGHLADNGMGYLKYIAYLLIAAGLFFLVRRQWARVGIAAAVLVAFGALVGFMSSGMRGDVVAYGSERNEQWAAALAGQPRYAPIAWLEPEAIGNLRRQVDVSCCTNEAVLREEGTYPRQTGIGTRVGKYRISATGALASTTFLTDYIDVAEDGAGDWLAFYNQCVAPAQWDMEDYARKYGKGAADRVTHENNMKLARRPEPCKTMEGVEEKYDLGLAARMTDVIAADGGRAAALLESDGLDAACAAHERCTVFERDFALDVK